MEQARDLLDRAKITVEDMVFFLPITKQTFYNWLNGKPVRDQLRFKLTATRFQMVEAALNKELLPLPDHTPKAARRALIREAFAKAK